MIRLYLLRHAEAEVEAADDSLRNLTELGWEQALASADWLCGQVATPARIITSPLLRARQTALVVQQTLNLPEATIDPSFLPDADIVRAEQVIAMAFRDNIDELIVVSHMPLIASLSCWLQEGVMSVGEAFSLAEVRIIEAEVLAPGLGQAGACFVPDETGRHGSEWRSLLPRL